MGTWGTGPFESDDAAEFKDEIVTAMEDPLRDTKQTLYRFLKPVHDVIRSPLTPAPSRRWSVASEHYAKARAAIAAFVFAHELAQARCDRPLVVEAMLTALEKMRSDKNWIASWKKPTRRHEYAIREQLNRELRDVRKLIAGAPPRKVPR